MPAATMEELGEFFAQEGRDSWCAFEVYEWVQKEIRVRDGTQKMLLAIMYEWVIKLVEGERSVEEVKSMLTQNSGDLALAEYARVGRALILYEVGDRAEAIAEMENMSLSLKGYPEVHGALAAALYADKHAPVPAEQQSTFATLLDAATQIRRG